MDRFFTALFDLHPLHSMTVHFPIALTAVALFLLLLALWRLSENLERAAFYNISLAAVSTLVAGLTGMRDNLIRYDGAAPNANIKLFLGISLLILASVTALSRRRRQEILWTPGTSILYVTAFAGSFALAATLGFLGGVILYGY